MLRLNFGIVPGTISLYSIIQKTLPRLVNPVKYINQKKMGLINNRKEATAWQKKYDDLSPKVGDSAPDFQLIDTSGKQVIQLSTFRGQKPVALIFGSFT